MTVIARLTALLTANSTQFESSLKRANTSMNRAQKSWNSDLNRANRSFSNFNRNIKSSIGSIGDLQSQLGGIAATVATALSAQRLIKYSDTWKQLEGRLRIVSSGVDEVAQSQEDLFTIAQRTRQPLEGIVSFYTRLRQFVPEAERAQFDFLGVTESVASALAITGESGSAATAAMIQFTQAVGTNFESAGQEIRSLQEQAPRLTQALVSALGGGAKSLKQLAEEGVLSRQTVLTALGGMSDESKKLRAELELVPVTVGQALQKLDNAFLKFIGQTEAIKNGTNSLSTGIVVLADNLNNLATAAIGLSAIFAARMIAPLGTVALSFAAATLSAYKYQLALASMAGVSRVAATAVFGLSAALNTTAGLVALLGGPIGVALLGTLGILYLKTRAASAAQRIMNERLTEHRAAANEFITAEAGRRKVIEETTSAALQNIKTELAAVNILYAAYNRKGFGGRFAQNLGAKVGIGQGVNQIVREGAALESAIDELENNLRSFETIKTGIQAPTTSGGQSAKEAEKIDKILQGLKDEAEQLELQTSLYGEKSTAIERASAALKIQQQLEAAGITLTQQQNEEVQKYLGSIQRQTELQNVQAEQQKELEEIEKKRKQSLEQLGNAFENAFDKAIDGGNKLSDVLEALGRDIIKLLAKAATQPLISSVQNSFNGSGFASSIASIFGGTPALATGIDYVPRDMYAKIHRGEAVVSAADNRGGGGGDVTVVVNNNTNSDVSTSAENTDSGINLHVMIDEAVADNITRKGSRTSQALGVRDSATLIRR